jgi:hypothetical protein
MSEEFKIETSGTGDCRILKDDWKTAFRKAFKSSFSDKDMLEAAINWMEVFMRPRQTKPLSEKSIKITLLEEMQKTSKYPDKKHLIAGDRTFISHDQLDDVVNRLATHFHAPTTPIDQKAVEELQEFIDDIKLSVAHTEFCKCKICNVVKKYEANLSNGKG